MRLEYSDAAVCCSVLSGALHRQLTFGLDCLYIYTYTYIYIHMHKHTHTYNGCDREIDFSKDSTMCICFK